MTYSLEINRRAFNAIKNETKKVEIRENTGNLDYSIINENDTIKFKNSDEIIVCKVIKNI